MELPFQLSFTPPIGWANSRCPTGAFPVHCNRYLTGKTGNLPHIRRVRSLRLGCPPAPHACMAQTTPSYLGPYRLLNIVHTGQNCRIWQAYDDENKCIVGVKTLLDKFQKDREQTQLLKWEYAIAKAFDHPLLIKVIHFAVDRGNPYLAIEWFSSPNLKQRLNQGIEKFYYLLPKVVEQGAEALAYVHKQGWVHRDVKPDNFLVTDEGALKLIDFALAKRQPSALVRMLGGGKTKVQGTRSYMAPEQIRGGAPDFRSDIYSYGCMVHELLAGKPPFTGVNSNDLLTKHLRTPPPPLEAFNSAVTSEFAQLIRKTMAKDPNARPNTMDEFLGELRRVRMFKITPKKPES